MNSEKNDLLPGDMIDGHYKVLALLGKGGGGAVYAVEQVLMKQRFALKTLTSAGTENSVRRFQKEVQRASKLDHPNLVRAVHFGFIDQHQFFLVMDFIEGQTLAQHLKQVGRLSVEEVLSIFIPLCFGLNYAHENGVFTETSSRLTLFYKMVPKTQIQSLR